MSRPDLHAGQIIELTDIAGRGGKRYQITRDGRELYALRDEAGSCKTKRYTLEELHAKRDAGLLREV